MKKLSNLIMFSGVFLVPTILEDAMTIYINNGNLGMYGLFLGIYDRRNSLYVSKLIYLLLKIYNNDQYCFGIVIFCCMLFRYVYYINKWKNNI